MYLTIKEHDQFRTLLMGFEIPYRAYIAKAIIDVYNTDTKFEEAMKGKLFSLSPSSPVFLRKTLPKACSKSSLKELYQKLVNSRSVDKIVVSELDLPVIGGLNLVSFALTEVFSHLYFEFGSYDSFCDRAEQFRYDRNKLDHPGCRSLEDSQMIPVLSFIKTICQYIDDDFFSQKSKKELLAEATALQQKRDEIPIKIENLSEMPFSENKIVCRDVEIQAIKTFIYGKPNALRKQHSCCVYGYGGVGKTALVLESVKQIVCDLQDGTALSGYSPEYLLFFSAKKRKLELSLETGKIYEKQVKCSFETADELIGLILSSLHIETLRDYYKQGIIIIDNLETLSLEERSKVKEFVDMQTPSGMQFIITSRNSEEYEINKKLAGFEADAGKSFVEAYNEENSLELNLLEEEVQELLSLSKGNTLVLVLSLRQLSQRLATVGELKASFSVKNAWRSLRSKLQKIPSNAYEVIAEFMFEDTFEHIETIFTDNIELFYKILKVFAIIPNEMTDINSVCLLTGEPYSYVEAVMDVLCSFLILEKRDAQYSLNGFAEHYIVSRFLPDAETYEKLSKEISDRQRNNRAALEQLQYDIEGRPGLLKIMKDWLIIKDSDKIAAAQMYKAYGEIKHACDSNKYKLEVMVDSFLEECQNIERVTAHPFIKYQKARILKMADDTNLLQKKHTDEIKCSYQKCIFYIKTMEEYLPIQQTKSYASLLWIYGLFLMDTKNKADAIRLLEESKASFEDQRIKDLEYFKCIIRLGELYRDYYLEDRSTRISYLRRARSICIILRNNRKYLGPLSIYSNQLQTSLQQYGQF